MLFGLFRFLLFLMLLLFLAARLESGHVPEMTAHKAYGARPWSKRSWPDAKFTRARVSTAVKRWWSALTSRRFGASLASISRTIIANAVPTSVGAKISIVETLARLHAVHVAEVIAHKAYGAWARTG